LNFDDFRPPDAGRRRQHGPEVAGERRHGVKRGCPGLMQPFHDLTRAILFFAGGSDKCFHFFQRKVEQVGQRIALFMQHGTNHLRLQKISP